MKLENQVCGLELAKRLKELGVKQESYFYWETTVGQEDKSVGVVIPWHGRNPADRFLEYCSAFAVAELGSLLPVYVSMPDGFRLVFIYGKTAGGLWSVSLRNNGIQKEFCEISEANSRAKMLIYLIEQGLLKP